MISNLQEMIKHQQEKMFKAINLHLFDNNGSEKNNSLIGDSNEPRIIEKSLCKIYQNTGI